jgi:hypothetical protein
MLLLIQNKRTNLTQRTDLNIIRTCWVNEQEYIQWIFGLSSWPQFKDDTFTSVYRTAKAAYFP